MAFYVYIIQSELDGSYYKGSSENYLKRLVEHNEGKSRYTARKKPWKLIYAEEHLTRASALKREKSLKKASGARLQYIITSNKNLIKN